MHNIINKLSKALFILTLSFASLNSYAESENSREFGDYVVHYNAFRSDTISPEVAKQYGLPRANNKVLINIAVLKKVMNTTGKPTKSDVTGHASNLTGQLKQLEFKEITEGTAIYYLGEFRVTPPDTLKFTTTIEVAGEPKREMVFKQKFYK